MHLSTLPDKQATGGLSYEKRAGCFLVMQGFNHTSASVDAYMHADVKSCWLVSIMNGPCMCETSSCNLTPPEIQSEQHAVSAPESLPADYYACVAICR